MLFRTIINFALLSSSAFAVVKPLEVKLIRGAGSNNNALSGSSIAIAVQVIDQFGKPIPDALVTFAAPRTGVSVDFAAQGPFAETVTDDSGVAVAPHEQPSGGNGPVEIRVTALHAGSSGSLVLWQMNLGMKQTAASEVVDIVPVSGHQPKVAVRVETSSGSPISGAEVSLTVRALHDNSKKAKIVSTETGATDASGIYSTALKIPKSEHDHVEVVAQTSWHGFSATRHFPIGLFAP